MEIFIPCKEKYKFFAGQKPIKRFGQASSNGKRPEKYRVPSKAAQPKSYICIDPYCLGVKQQIGEEVN